MAKKRKLLTLPQQIIRDLSDRIVTAQRPIRILDALKWTPDVQKFFFRHKFKKLPPIDENFYQKVPLHYDPETKTEEFYTIERDIRRQLGQFSGVGNIMSRMCREYREVVRMLQARGAPEFSKISQELYGSAGDVFYAGAPSLQDLAQMTNATLANIGSAAISELDAKIYTSKETVAILSKRLANYFNDPKQPVRVLISDGIIADAAAGAEYIKIRANAKFSERDIHLLEVHEGWVHIGSTMNGLAQPVCTFLSKGTPSAIVAQEGLAIIAEIFTFASYPGRVQRLTDRIIAVDMAERGANFIEVFNFFRDRVSSLDTAYSHTVRIFRGSTPTDGPFTKDLSYSKGFILIYNYIRLAIQRGLLSRIPLLFLGKTTLEDLHILEDLIKDGTVVPPRYMPPQFRDVAALSAWMCYSLFLNRISLERLSADYKDIL